MDKTKYLEWDINKLKIALKLSEEDIKKYFTDGRRVSFLTERIIAKKYKGNLSPSEGAGYDLIMPNKKKWEVRSLTKKGVYFCPSKMIGSGRSFEEKGFLNKLDEIEGYYICDIQKFPKVPYMTISSKIVRDHYFSGKFNKKKQNPSEVTRLQFNKLFGNF